MEANELIKLYDQADIADWFGTEPPSSNKLNNNHRAGRKHRIIITSVITGLLVAGTIGIITFFAKRR